MAGIQRRLRTIARGAAALVLALGGPLLAYEFAAAFPGWSNGWLEGASYALGAGLLMALAGLLWRGRMRSPGLLLCVAGVLALPGVWCARSALWLLGPAREVGPTPFYAPLLFALAAGLFLAAAALLALRAWRFAHDSQGR